MSGYWAGREAGFRWCGRVDMVDIVDIGGLIVRTSAMSTMSTMPTLSLPLTQINSGTSIGLRLESGGFAAVTACGLSPQANPDD